MKIYTYTDPFKLKEEKFWGEISKVPNLCVSQTLVQGLTSPGKNKYERQDYGYIYTVRDFMKVLYKEWCDNPENDIRQFVNLSNLIDQIDNESLRNAFKFNQRDVYDAVRLLIELGIAPEEIGRSDSQKLDKFTELYERLYPMDCWRVLDNIEVTEEKIVTSFKTLVKKEIRDLAELPRTQKTIDHLESCGNRINRVDKIVIHGVHRFEPMIIRLINDLTNLGIEVIFLINYIPDFERIYETWRRVYLWTGTEFIYGKDHHAHQTKNNLGEAIGGLLEGDIPEYDGDKLQCIKFHNYTSFSDYVSHIYAETIKNERSFSKSSRLNKMREQFYAVDNKLVNDILKQYHPEQFGNRHFLAYPIGQFILNMYNMWNDEKKVMEIDNRMFKECLATGFFQQEGRANPVETYRKLETYFGYFRAKGEFTLDILIEKVQQLRSSLVKITRAEERRGQKCLLRGFSTYNLDMEELEYFEDVLKSIDDIVRQLFADNSGDLNFKDHFQKLLQVLEEQDISKRHISAEERYMLDEIRTRLEYIKDVQLEGSIEDIRESLHFYLNRIDEKDDESNWIVRNFEQLDGGVLLSRNTRTERTYHLALVGDQDMNKSFKNFIPWPLDENFFITNQFQSLAFKIFYNSYKEYKNFLRYSLFYSTYFLKNKVNISYIENVGEQKNSLYFILDMLGLSSTDFDDDRYLIYESPIQYDSGFNISPPIYVDQLTTDEARNLLFCEYRYVLDELLDRGTNYETEYLQKLYYFSVLYKNSREQLNGADISSIEQVVEKSDENLKRYLLWDDIDSMDTRNKVINRILTRDIDKYTGTVKEIDDSGQNYLDIVIKFLYGRITEGYGDQSPSLIEDLWKDKKISKATDRLSIKINNYWLLTKPVEDRICEYCGQGDICLYRFRGDRL